MSGQRYMVSLELTRRALRAKQAYFFSIEPQVMARDPKAKMKIQKV